MASPKQKPKSKAESKPTVKTVGIRTSAEWAEWVERLAKHYRTTVSGVIDRALAEWTAAEGYEEKPPERNP
jgi:hypothetical protein